MNPLSDLVIFPKSSMAREQIRVNNGEAFDIEQSRGFKADANLAHVFLNRAWKLKLQSSGLLFSV